MKVLIAGGSGLVGMHLAAQLTAESSDVVATVRADDERAEILRRRGARPVVCDLSAPGAEEGLSFSAAWVVYLAQSSRFREFPAGTSDMMAVNAVAPTALARWAADRGASRFVYASTGAVYSPSLSAHGEDEVVTPGAHGFYPASKSAAEALLRPFSAVMHMVIVRPFFVYGPWMNPTMLMNTLVDSIRSCRPVRLGGDADGLRFQPTPGTEAARQISGILSAPDVAPVYNVAATESFTLREVAEVIGTIVGQSPVFEHVPGDPQVVLADTSRIERLVGRTSLTLDEGVRRLCGA